MLSSTAALQPRARWPRDPAHQNQTLEMTVPLLFSSCFMDALWHVFGGRIYKFRCLGGACFKLTFIYIDKGAESVEAGDLNS